MQTARAKSQGKRQMRRAAKRDPERKAAEEVEQWRTASDLAFGA